MRVRPVERIFAEDELHLPGVDVVLPKQRHDLRLERRAVRAGHRGIFDHRDLRVFRAVHHIGRLEFHGLPTGRARQGRARIAADEHKRKSCRERRENFPVHEPAPDESPGQGFGRGPLSVQSARFGGAGCRRRARRESASESEGLPSVGDASSASRVRRRWGCSSGWLGGVSWPAMSFSRTTREAPR